MGWSVFSLALSHLTRGRVTCHLAVALCNLVTLLDTATAPLLAGRLAAASLGGISMAALALDLWGECWHAGALKEGFRLVALGRPAYVADLTESGAAKRPGSAEGFYNRTIREDEATGWQSLLLPVVLVGSAVFGVLASFGQGHGANFLWCWSAILTAGTALSLPFTYSLPYFRLARRLGKSGCAVAGYYGARQLGYSRELLVGDEDLFPAGTMKMAGMKTHRRGPAEGGGLRREPCPGLRRHLAGALRGVHAGGGGHPAAHGGVPCPPGGGRVRRHPGGDGDPGDRQPDSEDVRPPAQEPGVEGWAVPGR